VALRLEHRGITRVHPLEGGVARWMELRYPVDALVVAMPGPAAAG
jgi:hypothetical protein